MDNSQTLNLDPKDFERLKSLKKNIFSNSILTSILLTSGLIIPIKLFKRSNLIHNPLKETKA